MQDLLYAPTAGKPSISRGASPYKGNLIFLGHGDKGSRSRAGDPNMPPPSEDPNRLMIRETGAGVAQETMQKNLSKDREYERILN